MEPFTVVSHLALHTDFVVVKREDLKRLENKLSNIEAMNTPLHTKKLSSFDKEIVQEIHDALLALRDFLYK